MDHSQGDLIPTQIHRILKDITQHPQTKQMSNADTPMVETNAHFYMNTDFLEKKLDQPKAERQGKDGKITNSI